MSIVASVKVYDGIVLGADSRTQLIAKTDHGISFIKAYDHARKLFEVSSLKTGILTYGVGNIGRRSLESYLVDFTSAETSSSQSVKDTAEKLLRFLTETYREQYDSIPKDKWPQLGVLVAGYSENQSLPEEWEFIIPNAKIAPVRPPDNFGASWRGTSLPFSRLYKGFDPRMLNQLLLLLKDEHGISEKTLKTITETAEQFTTPFVFDGMPLPDAIRFTRFILETTVNMGVFEAGVAACGGPLDIAVITRSEGFQWIHEKTLVD